MFSSQIIPNSPAPSLPLLSDFAGEQKLLMASTCFRKRSTKNQVHSDAHEGFYTIAGVRASNKPLAYVSTHTFARILLGQV